MPEGRLLVVDYGYPFILIVLVVVHIWSKVLVEVLVDYLSLVISLQVVSCRELQLCAYMATELILEV
jgi:hypothetical protein